MPQHFADRLNEQIEKKNSVVCVGLDPVIDRIPDFIKEKQFKEHKDPFKAVAESFIVFGKGIIDAVHDLVPVLKPQSAYFEQYGAEGFRAMKEILDYAKEKGLLTIADIKRGDIGSTSEAYAKAFLGKVMINGQEVPSFDVDAVTISPYLGWDGIKPFVEVARKYGKGVFVLVKTSNPSSADLQDLEMQDGNSVYEIMAQLLDSWGADEIGDSNYSDIGAVVGATYPEQMADVRKLLPNAIFLVPGYGAQGGTAEDVKAAFNEDGRGAIVNSSRGINYAWEKSDTYTEKDYAAAARAATEAMIADLKSARG